MSEWLSLLPWGRHAPYVAGSLLLCALAVAIEWFMLRQRQRTWRDSVPEAAVARRAPVLTRKGAP